MSSEVVIINGKEIEVKEKKIKELKILAKEITKDVKTDELFKGDTPAEMINNGIELIKNKLTVIFPGIIADDIEESTVSEIKELINTFIKVNFGEVEGLKNVFSLLLRLV